MRDSDCSADAGTPARPGVETTDEDDPALHAFLAFIDGDMLEHPERIQPLDSALIARMEALVEGMDVDPDEDLGDGVGMPGGEVNREPSS